MARAKAALGEHVTPGPWVVNREGWAVISSGSDSVIHGYVDTACESCGADVKGNAQVAVSIEDAEFIAAARTLVPELVAEVERLRGQAEQFRVFARVSVENGDLTEVGARVLNKIADRLEAS